MCRWIPFDSQRKYELVLNTKNINYLLRKKKMKKTLNEKDSASNAHKLHAISISALSCLYTRRDILENKGDTEEGSANSINRTADINHKLSPCYES